MGTLFGRQIVLSMHKKVDKENSPGAIISNFKYRYHPEKTKKKFKCSSFIITCQPRVLHGFINAAAIQPRQNRVGELQPALAVISIQKRTKKNNCDRNWRENSQRRLRVHANAHAENHQSQHKKKYKTPPIERNIAQPCTKFEIRSNKCANGGHFFYRLSVDFFHWASLVSHRRNLFAVIRFHSEGILVWTPVPAVCCGHDSTCFRLQLGVPDNLFFHRKKKMTLQRLRLFSFSSTEECLVRLL